MAQAPEGVAGSDAATSAPGVCTVCGSSSLLPFASPAQRYWRCSRCEATLLDSSHWLDRAAEQRHYQLHRNHCDDPGYRRFLNALAQPLLAHLPPGRSGLDYGCGPGSALAAMLREAGHTMALYDPLFCSAADVLTQRYDFITCTEVAEHFHHPAMEFSRLDTLLAPGGTLAVMTCFLTDAIRFESWHYRRDPTHVVFYREATFVHVAAQHGWQGVFPCANVVLLHKPPFSGAANGAGPSR